MIPSHLKEASAKIPVKNSFISDNNRIIVNVARGGSKLTREQLTSRLDEYYKRFSRDVCDFNCIRIKKRKFLDDTFGELCYSSKMMGYSFYNIFILGIYEDVELIVTMQCMLEDAAGNERIFDNIADSIRVIKKDRIRKNDTCV